MNLTKLNQTNLLFNLVSKEFKLIYRSSVFYAVVVFFILGASAFFIGGDNWFNSGISDFKIFFLNMPFLFCIIIPMLTMNSFSDEKKYFTDKLLFSFPISFRLVLFAKFINLIFIWFLILLLSSLIPFSVFKLGYFSLGSFIISYLAMFLFGSGLISICLAISLLSKHTALNFLLSFLVILFFSFFTSYIKLKISNPFLQNLIAYFSFTSHFETSARGIFDSKDFIFYFILIAFGFELGVLILNIQRSQR